jgi:hypothetical protein
VLITEVRTTLLSGVWARMLLVRGAADLPRRPDAASAEGAVRVRENAALWSGIER